MPVSSHHVPLDTAKAWAKRLARFSHDHQASHAFKLHQAQAAVADMLGFDDWHALTQRLSQSLKTPPAPGVSLANTPKTREDWAGLWQGLLAADGTIDIHFEKRREALRVRVRQDGVFRHGWAAISMDAFEALASLAGVTPQNEHIDFFGMEYVDGIWVPQSKDPRYCLRYQSLPVYPEGRDVVIRRQAIRPHAIPTDWFPQHQERLKEQLYAGSGLVVVAGTSGSGRTSFAFHLLKMARLNRPHEQLKTLILSDDFTQSGEVPGQTMFSRTEAGQNLSSLATRVKNGVDLFLVDDLRTPEEMTIVRKAIGLGTLVFITFNSSSARNVLERVQDFVGPNKQPETIARDFQLRMSTYVKTVPLVCPQCSSAGTDYQEKGPGCVFCHGTGQHGRALQAQAVRWKGHQPQDLWPRWEQVQRLLNEKRVSRGDIEEALGPEPFRGLGTDE